ncbi:MAG TPA: lipoprotein signal peptidase [Parasegetibacter sp.]
MKLRNVVLIILLILVVDQALKIWVKTGFYMWEERKVIGEWFRLHFIENEGMAWGWKFGGEWGKIALTLFRLVAVVFGVYYIGKIVREKFHKGFIICAAMIFAGALGNLIDSMFYGMIFEASDPYTRNLAQMFPEGGGYAGFLHGRVVDMFYFPIIRDAHFPDWLPIWGGEEFVFFRPVFNVADASISLGVIFILLFQRKFFPGDKQPEDGERQVPAEGQ